MAGALSLALAAAPGGAQARAGASGRDTLTAAERRMMRDVSAEARSLARRRLAPDTAATRQRGAAAAGTAFGSPEAQELLSRARRAREVQDSALTAYEATTTQRISTGLGVRTPGLEKLLFRGDNVARIRWRRGTGVWVEPIGSRIVVPSATRAQGDFSRAVTIPYFPGRETLWFPSSSTGVIRTDVDEMDILNPLARGAEAYYRYDLGDSVRISLEGGRVIRLRELKIAARRPDWRAFVGSFWFDADGGQLVRAAYRLAANLELWDVADEVEERNAPVSRLRDQLRDSLARARLPRDVVRKDSLARAGTSADGPPAWVKFAFRPARGTVDAITVEYGLYQGKFWLPRAHSAAGGVQVGFLRVPVRWDEKFTYASVNGDLSLDPLPAILSGAARDSALQDTAVVDPRFQRNRVEVRVGVGGSTKPPAPDTARISVAQARQCATDSMWTRTETRYNGALRLAYRLPCDARALSASPALPPALGSDEQVFDRRSSESLARLLALDMQPPFALQRPSLRVSSEYVRYNRIEGLSLGLGVVQPIGGGFTLTGVGRFGLADLHANGELTLTRAGSGRTVTASLYHRLAAVNPEWAGALSLGPSISALLLGRDDGFYYRALGASLRDETVTARGRTSVGLFLERQWSAGDSNVTKTFSFARLLAGRRFAGNILAEPLAITGVDGAWSRVFGDNPDRTRLTVGTRGEAGTGTYAYARLAGEATVTQPVGRMAIALSGSAGSSIGRVPTQRFWYLGGARTVRGQVPGTEAGNAYWLGRAEVGPTFRAVRPVLFYDAGWAGSRSTFSGTTPHRGAGLGLSVLDGLFRVDLARGLYPLKKWRMELYFESVL